MIVGRCQDARWRQQDKPRNPVICCRDWYDAVEGLVFIVGTSKKARHNSIPPSPYHSASRIEFHTHHHLIPLLSSQFVMKSTVLATDYLPVLCTWSHGGLIKLSEERECLYRKKTIAIPLGLDVFFSASISVFIWLQQKNYKSTFATKSARISSLHQNHGWLCFR